LFIRRRRRIKKIRASKINRYLFILDALIFDFFLKIISGYCIFCVRWERLYLKEIRLTDKEAQYLIKILKLVLKKYKVDLKPGQRGEISLKSYDDRHGFILNYYTPKHRDDKINIHIREKETNISLVRVNIDPDGFHNNSDGTVIRGNRILIFSSEEFYKKNDGFTHVRAYNLPEDFTDPSDLEQVFLDFLRYINVKQEGKIEFAELL
jgi:hypothetical protein